MRSTNIIHYVCGMYPHDFGGVARFDSLLAELFPKRIFLKAQEQATELYNFCLENPLTTLVITDNQHACDVPQNIPCIIFHHGVARTHAERDPEWTPFVRDLCVNGQDAIFTHRLPYNTVFISISKFCSDEFSRHYGAEYAKFRSILLHVPVEKRISSITHNDQFNMSSLKCGEKPRILGDWSTINKGSSIIPLLKEKLNDEFEFVQLKTPKILDVDQHRKNIATFYTRCQMYFQTSTSEGSSFASEDGLAYGLLVVASNVGQFYETPLNVAATYDWSKRKDIDYLASTIRTAWANRSQYNATEWMKEYLDWDKWATKLEAIVQEFTTKISPRIISFPIVQRNAPIFWQYPVITEKYCLDMVIKMKVPPFIYVGIPYATLIDKSLFPLAELTSIGTQIQILKKLVSPRTRIITVCQHIHYDKILSIVKMLGITDIYISHKKRGQASLHDGLRIHGLPLYPVNVFDQSRTSGIPTILPVKRSYLFSFIGAYMRHYLNPIRQRILSWPPSKDDTYIIQDTKIWHFEKAVYQHQVMGTALTNTDKMQHDAQTIEYNRILANSTFSLCPVGAGPNTIRLWESICLGSIPIIIADEFDIKLCLPLKFGTDWYIELPYTSPHLICSNDLETYLQGISQDIIEEMRTKCKVVAEYLRTTFIPLPATSASTIATTTLSSTESSSSKA